MGNTAQETGGAIVVYDAAAAYIWDSNFTQNIARDDGGAILVLFAQATVTSSVFAQNVVRDSGGGGAIACYESSMWLWSSQFVGNKAGDGGAINIQDAVVSVVGSEFTQNTASDAGGAVVATLESMVSIMTSYFTSNSAFYGGGIAAANSSILLQNSTLSSNSANQGAAVYLEDTSSLGVDYCVFSQNVASANGDSLYCTGSNVSVSGSNVVPGDSRPTEQNGVYCDNSTAANACAISAQGSGNWTDVCNDKFPSKPSGSNSLAPWKIAIIVIFVVLGVVLIAGVVFYFATRKKPQTSFSEM